MSGLAVNGFRLLIFVAAHDLHKPLRKVQSFGDRLKLKYTDFLPEDGHRYIERMRSSAQRMQMLIDDLMNYSRVGTQGGSFVSVDMNKVVRGVVSDLEETISNAGAMVEIGDLPTIDANQTQRRQLLQNLISDGLKFRRQDVQPVVSIVASSLDRSELDQTDRTLGIGQCEIVVKDNGIGFETKHSEYIFEEFKRLHGANKYDGSGIGLSICRRIVERHIGRISAVGCPGEGAEFCNSLPVQQAKQEVAYESA